MNKERTYLLILLVSVVVAVWLGVRLDSGNLAETLGLVVAAAFAGASINGILRLASPSRPTPRPTGTTGSRQTSARQAVRPERSGGVRKNATPAKHRGKKETGQVKWFRGSKGYGFITPDNGGEDYFVHRSSVKNGNLNQGDRVEFVVTKDDKGRIAAENVVKI